MSKMRIRIVLILLVFLLMSCKHKINYTIIKDTGIITYLNEIKVDTFTLNNLHYPGAVYLFANCINDSVYIYFMPVQCIFSEKDLLSSFEYNKKLFICQGKMEVFESIINFDKKSNELESNNLREWKLCSEIGYLDDYDPKTFVLLLDNKTIEKVNPSQEITHEIIFGVRFPPPPPQEYN